MDYANEFDIKFNPLKCQFLCYGDSRDVVFKFDGVDLEPIKKGIHLGHLVGPNVHESAILEASNTLTRKVNSILHNFRHCSYDVKYKLFNSYCTSYYGCPLWNLSSNVMSRFYVTWRKSIRRLFDLPNMTHCDLLPVIADCKNIETQLLCRMSKFVYKAMSSQNIYLRMLMNVATAGSRSILSKSFNHMLFKSKLSNHVFKTSSLSCMIKNVSDVNSPSESTYQVGAFARSVLFERENVNFLTAENLNTILNILCTE